MPHAGNRNFLSNNRLSNDLEIRPAKHEIPALTAIGAVASMAGSWNNNSVALSLHEQERFSPHQGVLSCSGLTAGLKAGAESGSATCRPVFDSLTPPGNATTIPGARDDAVCYPQQPSGKGSDDRRNPRVS